MSVHEQFYIVVVGGGGGVDGLFFLSSWICVCVVAVCLCGDDCAHIIFTVIPSLDIPTEFQIRCFFTILLLGGAITDVCMYIYRFVYQPLKYVGMTTVASYK